MIKVVFFDMDGLLADSEPVHRKAWNEILEPYNLYLDGENLIK